MKTLIPLLSLVCGSFAVHNCTHEENEYPVQKELNREAEARSEMNISGTSDSTKSKSNELDPDPPVKDTHDWRTKP